jgi:hypothetical protein
VDTTGTASASQSLCYRADAQAPPPTAAAPAPAKTPADQTVVVQNYPEPTREGFEKFLREDVGIASFVSVFVARDQAVFINFLAPEAATDTAARLNRWQVRGEGRSLDMSQGSASRPLLSQVRVRPGSSVLWCCVAGRGGYDNGGCEGGLRPQHALHTRCGTYTGSLNAHKSTGC